MIAIVWYQGDSIFEWGVISLQKRLGKTRVTQRVSVRTKAFYKTTKSCLIEGLITLSYNVYTFWMDTVFFFFFFCLFV